MSFSLSFFGRAPAHPVHARHSVFLVSVDHAADGLAGGAEE